MYETSCQSRFDARYWMLGAGALGRPRGIVWGGRREEGSGWGTHVYLWRIHFSIWQNQYNIVKFKKKKKKRKETTREHDFHAHPAVKRHPPHWSTVGGHLVSSRTLTASQRSRGNHTPHGVSGGHVGNSSTSTHSSQESIHGGLVGSQTPPSPSSDEDHTS